MALTAPWVLRVSKAKQDHKVRLEPLVLKVLRVK